MRHIGRYVDFVREKSYLVGLTIVLAISTTICLIPSALAYVAVAAFASGNRAFKINITWSAFANSWSFFTVCLVCFLGSVAWIIKGCDHVVLAITAIVGLVLTLVFHLVISN